MKEIRKMLRGLDESDIRDGFGRYMAYAYSRGLAGAQPASSFARGGCLLQAAREGYAQHVHNKKLQTKVGELRKRRSEDTECC